MSGVSVHIEFDDRWTRRGDTYVRGRAFRNGRLLRAEGLASLVEATQRGAFESVVGGLNGFFAVIRAEGDTARGAVDHVRSIPLFYARDDGRAYVSDDAQWILGRLDDPGYDQLADAELTAAGLVTGRDTLIPAIKQLQAGEHVELDASDDAVTWRRSRPVRYRPDPAADVTLGSLRADLEAATAGAIERLVRVADGRPVAVSLSGGVDSRLVASELAATDYDRVLTFSFGRPGNPEMEAAREVADAEALRDRIGQRWPGGTRPAADAAAAVEAWDLAERQAKFIVSGDEYADWGYDWWLPLFDRELFALWQRVPLAYRRGKGLHGEHADACYAGRVGVERALEVTEDRPGVVDRVRTGVARSPAGDVAQAVVDQVRPSGSVDPLGLQAIVPEPIRGSSADRQRSAHAFKALELLGRASLADGRAEALPDDGVVAAGGGIEPTLPDRVADRPWFQPDPVGRD